MGGNGNQEIDSSDLTIQKALEISRNTEGLVDPVIRNYLDRQLRAIWARIEAEPDSYILNKDEFALFNYYRYRATSSTLAQSAIKRFWDNYVEQPQTSRS